MQTKFNCDLCGLEYKLSDLIRRFYKDKLIHVCSACSKIIAFDFLQVKIKSLEKELIQTYGVIEKLCKWIRELRKILDRYKPKPVSNDQYLKKRLKEAGLGDKKYIEQFRKANLTNHKTEIRRLIPLEANKLKGNSVLSDSKPCK